MGMRPDLPPPPQGLTQTQCLDWSSKHNPTSDGTSIWCETCWLEFPTVEDFEHAICWKPWMIPVGTLEHKFAAREAKIGLRCWYIERAKLSIYELIINDQEMDESNRVMIAKWLDAPLEERRKATEAVMSLPLKEPVRRRRR